MGLEGESDLGDYDLHQDDLNVNEIELEDGSQGPVINSGSNWKENLKAVFQIKTIKIAFILLTILTVIDVLQRLTIFASLQPALIITACAIGVFEITMDVLGLLGLYSLNKPCMVSFIVMKIIHLVYLFLLFIFEAIALVLSLIVAILVSSSDGTYIYDDAGEYVEALNFPVWIFWIIFIVIGIFLVVSIVYFILSIICLVYFFKCLKYAKSKIIHANNIEVELNEVQDDSFMESKNDEIL
eukprot:TRINITY_DN16649_c0_g1_i1.p1 TRINITY_DN16649_c0_g1~~TRINITY_DN16649_c0_g1_i1.p1  ORF type:complete len:241 (-),score=38.28 TRINITY_DN16649_c0_g1_i1:163-885(-)